MTTMPKIAYQDKDILIIDKPQGLATATGKKDNLCQWVWKLFPELKKVKGHKENEGGLLNRLDNETGGLVLFARNNRAFKHYGQAMRKEKIAKKYLALVCGKVEKEKGEINTPLAHHKTSAKKMTTFPSPHRSHWQKAKTEWQLIKYQDNNSLLDVEITKGIRHQIRIHLASIGHPIIGDKTYGKKQDSLIKNHLLYCYQVSFTNPEGRKKQVKVEVPEIFL